MFGSHEPSNSATAAIITIIIIIIIILVIFIVSLLATYHITLPEISAVKHGGRDPETTLGLYYHYTDEKVSTNNYYGFQQYYSH